MAHVVGWRMDSNRKTTVLEDTVVIVVGVGNVDANKYLKIYYIHYKDG
jgi:hypothetical protein